tara:strand:+ start:1067 stop:1288 length:222 start_codon:yes stop_codon:yes gene_type:complete
LIEEEIEFCKEVEKLVSSGSYDSYIDAIIHLCEQQEMEPFMAARLLSDPIKEKIQKEGQDINLLPKSTELPLK